MSPDRQNLPPPGPSPPRPPISPVQLALLRSSTRRVERREQEQERIKRENRKGRYELRSSTIGVRDRVSGWLPIRRNFTQLTDPNSAIFPYKWINHHKNPNVLVNPGHCPDDPLKGACLPKDKWWLVATRYGDLDAVKYRKLELANKEQFHREKAYRDWRHQYIYIQGCADPIPLLSKKQTLRFGGPTGDLFGDKKIGNDKFTSVIAQQPQTGYYLGDAFLAEEARGARSLKRKAEDSEPDLTARNTTDSRYGGNAIIVRAREDVEEAEPTLGPLPRRGRTPRAGVFTAALDNQKDQRRIRSMIQAFTSSTRFAYRTMRSVSKFMANGVRAIVGLAFRRRTYNVVEQRIADQQTGNVRSKRRRVLSEGGDEDGTLRWISDDTHCRLLDRRHRLIGALRHTHSCIDTAIKPEEERTLGPNISDPWRDLHLENFFHCLGQLQVAADVIETVYATAFWTDMKAKYPTPPVRVGYFLQPSHIVRIKEALFCLENYDERLLPIVRAFDVSEEELTSVCADLRAILSDRPVPTMVLGSLLKDNAPWQPESWDSGPASDDSPTLSPAHLAAPVPARSRSPPDPDPMPGSFPAETANDRTKRDRFVLPEEEKENEEGVEVKLQRKKADLATTLPLQHETIPIEVIRKHLLSPKLAKLYGRRGKLSKAAEYRSKLPELEPLWSKKNLSTLPSPRRIRKEVYRKTLQVFPCPAKEYVPRDCYYWQYSLDSSPPNTQAPADISTEAVRSSQNSHAFPATPTTALSAADHYSPNALSSPCPPARPGDLPVPSIVISSASPRPIPKSPAISRPALTNNIFGNVDGIGAMDEGQSSHGFDLFNTSHMAQIDHQSKHKAQTPHNAAQNSIEMNTKGVDDQGDDQGYKQMIIQDDKQGVELEHPKANLQTGDQSNAQVSSTNSMGHDAQLAVQDDMPQSYENYNPSIIYGTLPKDELSLDGEAASDESSELKEEIDSRYKNILNRAEEAILRKHVSHIPTPFADEDEDDEDSELMISDEKQDEIGDISAELQLLFDVDEHVKRQRIAAEKAEAAKREQEKRLRATGGLRPPSSVLVAPLSEDWIRRVRDTLRLATVNVVETKLGTGLRPHDFGKVVPSTAWLNDEIVNGSLEWLDDYTNTAAGITNDRSSIRKCLCLSSFLWPKIEGGNNTDRALRRVGISAPAHFLQLETLLIPICKGYHWTLMVVRPQKRTVAHMDSLNEGGSRRYLEITMKWLRATLKDHWNQQQWSIVRHQAPQQTNGYDCGIHTITNAMCVALGIHPIEAYRSTDMPLQRLRIAAMLLNKGFTDDFDLSSI